MGVFYYPMELASEVTGEFHKLRALVDTGALYSWAPGGVLQELGLQPMGIMPFQMADGTAIERQFTEAKVRIEGRVRTTIVIFGAARDQTPLGAYTLEGCGLCADSVNRRLIPMDVVPAVTPIGPVG
ncbi:MAG TPA: aspartyl protease [Dehalococcoidia bacterium]|jgi:clan AA aspartic protease